MPPMRATPTAPAYVTPPCQQRKHVLVLIVDAQPANIAFLRLLLDYSGYEVLTARNAAEALQSAWRAEPQVIISDVHMPEESGLVLMERVRRDPRLRDVPFILVSASAQRPQEMERAAMLGGA